MEIPLNPLSVSVFFFVVFFFYIASLFKNLCETSNNDISRSRLDSD